MILRLKYSKFILFQRGYITSHRLLYILEGFSLGFALADTSRQAGAFNYPTAATPGERMIWRRLFKQSS